MLIKPEVNSCYLSNGTNVKYLDISKVKPEMCEEDIAAGGTQFADIKKLSDKGRLSNACIVSGNSIETCYKAIAYYMSVLNSKDDGQQEDNDEDDDYDETSYDDPYNEDNREEPAEDSFDPNNQSEWTESRERIPIIRAIDVTSRFSSLNCSQTFVGILPVIADSTPNQNRPFWMNCCHEAVIIICQENEAVATMFSESDIELFQYFKNNRRVFFIFNDSEKRIDDKDHVEDNKNKIDQIDDDDESPMYGGGSMFVPKLPERLNLLKIAFSADEINCRYADTNEFREYCKRILKATIEASGARVVRGFDYDKAIDKVMFLKTVSPATIIERVIRYAMRDHISADTMVFNNKSFDFLSVLNDREKIKKEAGSAQETLMRELVGMDSVKRQVSEVVSFMKYNELRKSEKLAGSEYHNTHLFIGAPGTAKTEIAKRMGEIMVEEKLLPGSRFISVNGAELKGKYVGWSAPRVHDLFKRYDIIFIDEAYSIIGKDGTTDTFSDEAISQLIIEMEDHSTDKLIILAGYGGRKVTEKNNRMKSFIDSNPGIKSRITSTIFFDSYTAKEMGDIFMKQAELKHYRIAAGCKEKAEDYFKYRVNDENFGNGREARSLLETSTVFAAKRIMDAKNPTTDRSKLQEITADDVERAIERKREENNIEMRSNSASIGFAV